MSETETETDTETDTDADTDADTDTDSGRGRGRSRGRGRIRGAIQAGSRDEDHPAPLPRRPRRRHGRAGARHRWLGEALPAGGGTLAPNPFVQIGSDGVVSIVCKRSEMGQGVRSSIHVAIR